jgi:hypothetical protein
MSLPAFGTQQSYPLPQGTAEGPFSIGRRLLDVILGARAANLAVALAIVIGFFHGWLKLKIRHPIAVFLFDIPLLVALLITFSRVKSLGDWFPEGRARRALMVFYGVVVIWFALAFLLPWGAPWLAALAALRGWALATVMFGLGYHIIQSRRQLQGYFVLVIVLAAITAAYATRQTLEEVEAMRAMDPYFELMTRGQNYVDDEGRLVLRRFSTFISSGAFGGTMAVSLLFLAALLTDRSIARKEKAVLLILALIIGWGLSLSGSRSALVALGLGLGILVWFRRLPHQLLLLGVAFGFALLLTAHMTGGGVWDRFSNLDLKTVWGRFYIAWAPGIRFLLESGLLGGGLGKAGVGFPMSLAQYFGEFEMWGVDGDLGKTMAELGIVGVGVIAWVLFAGICDGWEMVGRRRLDPEGTLGLGAICAFAIAVVTFPIGSPFIGIPLGVLTWFFLGAAIKVDRLKAGAHRGAMQPGDESLATTPEMKRRVPDARIGATTAVPCEVQRRRAFLVYQPPPGVTGVVMNPAQRDAEEKKVDDACAGRAKASGKRFLYQQP